MNLGYRYLPSLIWFYNSSIGMPSCVLRASLVTAKNWVLIYKFFRQSESACLFPHSLILIDDTFFRTLAKSMMYRPFSYFLVEFYPNVAILPSKFFA